MKKVILLIVVILLSGCSATYDLYITGENFKETITVVEDARLGDSYLFNYIQGVIDDGLSLKKDNSFEKYEIRPIDDGIDLGLLFVGNFKGDNKQSNFIYKNCSNYSVDVKSDSLTIKASGFKVFDEYDELDSLKINLKTSYEVINSNADAVENQVASWVIDKSNYDTKKINITFKIDNVKKSSNIGNDPMIKFGIVIFTLVIFCFIIYKVLMNSYRRNNNL